MERTLKQFIFIAGTFAVAGLILLWLMRLLGKRDRESLERLKDHDQADELLAWEDEHELTPVIGHPAPSLIE
jgi:Fe2+ transport system protein B